MPATGWTTSSSRSSVSPPPPPSPPPRSPRRLRSRKRLPRRPPRSSSSSSLLLLRPCWLRCWFALLAPLLIAALLAPPSCWRPPSCLLSCFLSCWFLFLSFFSPLSGLSDLSGLSEASSLASWSPSCLFFSPAAPASREAPRRSRRCWFGCSPASGAAPFSVAASAALSAGAGPLLAAPSSALSAFDRRPSGRRRCWRPIPRGFRGSRR